MSTISKLNGKNTVRGATFLLIITLFISNLLGLIRDRLLASTIHAGDLDAYYAAFRLPDLLTNLIVVGAISVVFIPIFTEERAKKDNDAWAAATAILNLMIAVLGLGAAILWLGMPFFMKLVVPDFDTDKLNLTIQLARWLTLTPILFGVSYILSGVLNSFQRFTVYSVVPLVYNLSIICGILWLAPRYGVKGIVFGVVLGAFLHMAIQLPFVAALGWRWKPSLEFLKHSAVKKVGGLMLPRIVGLGAMQFVAIVATSIASKWAGAIAYYNFANNIQTMPTAVFASSIVTALFPTLSDAAAKDDETTFRRQLIKGIQWILFMLIPATAGIVILRAQIVRIILGAGLFDWNATTITADTLGWFALSLIATGLVPLLARAFYARQDMKTPMRIAIISALIIIGLSYLLPAILPTSIPSWSINRIHTGDVAALAIAYTIGTIINMVWLAIALKRKLNIDFRPVWLSSFKIILATVLMGFAVQLAKLLTVQGVDLRYGIGVLTQLVVSIFVGVLTYTLSVAWLGCSEWREIAAILQKKITFTTK